MTITLSIVIMSTAINNVNARYSLCLLIEILFLNEKDSTAIKVSRHVFGCRKISNNLMIIIIKFCERVVKELR